jgi:hypothetical protein
LVINGSLNVNSEGITGSITASPGAGVSVFVGLTVSGPSDAANTKGEKLFDLSLEGAPELFGPAAGITVPFFSEDGPDISNMELRAGLALGASGRVEGSYSETLIDTGESPWCPWCP